MLPPEATQDAAPRYQLEAQLGGARSGEVWRARDSQSGAAVIWKRIVRESLPSVAALERAQRELKQLQRAQSPRIARVLDYGKDPEGRLFVVTELYDGRPLDALVAQSGPFPLDRAKRIVAQIGEALLEGQKVGVVHHDLAAKNVLVGSGDEVKVINFVAPCPISDTVFGVPEYLSPEQAEGKLVDQRSNTYSLGGIFGLMLTGQPPATGADAGAIIDQVLKGEVIPPSRRAPGLTPEVDRVVGKAMEKSPNRRPLTLRQFLTDVGNLAANPALSADPNRGMGFAKTMMFTGGSPEVQRLVNQAVAARAEGNGTSAQGGTPPLAPVEDPGMRTPPPEAAAGQQPVGRTHGAAIAATVVSLPAASVHPGGTGPGMSASRDAEPVVQTTPPPLTVAPPPSAAMGAAPTPKPAAGGNFRETLWFKKGDVDQMVADARARVEATRGKGAPPPEAELPAEVVAAEDARPIEERYVDDGSVTAEDRKKFSLRSGATSAALPTVGGMVPGERMSDTEVVGEIGGKKRLLVIGIVVAAVLIALVAVVALGFRNKDTAKSAAAMTPVQVPSQPTAPSAPAAPPAAAPVPTPAKVAQEDGAPAAAKPRHAAARKQAAKKAKATAKTPAKSKKRTSK
jgi:hypothetical protein